MKLSAKCVFAWLVIQTTMPAHAHVTVPSSLRSAVATEMTLPEGRRLAYGNYGGYGNNNNNNMQGEGYNGERNGYQNAYGYEAQQRANQRWEEYGGLDIANYSIRYTGCSMVEEYNFEYDGGEDEEAVVNQRYATFRMCKSDSCSNNVENGCNSNYIDYVVRFDDFLEMMDRDEQNGYYSEYLECQAVDMGEQQAGYGGQNYQQGGGYNNNYYWQGQQQEQYEQLYIGPLCDGSSSGNKVSLGVFTDEDCTVYPSRSISVADVLGYNPYPQGMQAFSDSCRSCTYDNGQNNWNYYGQNNGEDAEISEMCESLYQLSGQCNQNNDNWNYELDTQGKSSTFSGLSDFWDNIWSKTKDTYDSWGNNQDASMQQYGGRNNNYNRQRYQNGGQYQGQQQNGQYNNGQQNGQYNNGQQNGQYNNGQQNGQYNNGQQNGQYNNGQQNGQYNDGQQNGQYNNGQQNQAQQQNRQYNYNYQKNGQYGYRRNNYQSREYYESYQLLVKKVYDDAVGCAFIDSLDHTTAGQEGSWGKWSSQFIQLTGTEKVVNRVPIDSGHLAGLILSAFAALFMLFSACHLRRKIHAMTSPWRPGSKVLYVSKNNRHQPRGRRPLMSHHVDKSDADTVASSVADEWDTADKVAAAVRSRPPLTARNTSPDPAATLYMPRLASRSRSPAKSALKRPPAALLQNTMESSGHVNVEPVSPASQGFPGGPDTPFASGYVAGYAAANDGVEKAQSVVSMASSVPTDGNAGYTVPHHGVRTSSVPIAGMDTSSIKTIPRTAPRHGASSPTNEGDVDYSEKDSVERMRD